MKDRRTGQEQEQKQGKGRVGDLNCLSQSVKKELTDYWTKSEKVANSISNGSAPLSAINVIIASLATASIFLPSMRLSVMLGGVVDSTHQSLVLQLMVVCPEDVCKVSERTIHS